MPSIDEQVDPSWWEKAIASAIAPKRSKILADEAAAAAAPQDLMFKGNPQIPRRAPPPVSMWGAEVNPETGTYGNPTDYLGRSEEMGPVMAPGKRGLISDYLKKKKPAQVASR